MCEARDEANGGDAQGKQSRENEVHYRLAGRTAQRGTASSHPRILVLSGPAVGPVIQMNTPVPSRQQSLRPSAGYRLWLLAIGLTLLLGGSASAAERFVWFGCYTGKPPRGDGISVARYDETTGRFGPVSSAGTVTNPSFLALHPTLPVLYAVSEIANLNGQPTGGITSFTIDEETGHLTQQSVQPSDGRGPCHLSVDPSGRVLLAANYGSGSTICLGLEADGSLKPIVPTSSDAPGGFLQHGGNGPNKSRQQTPHGHSIDPTPDGRFAVSCDLGADRVFVHALNVEAATLSLQSDAATQPGGGPRHFVLHPSRPFGYANNELTMTVTAFQFDPEAGRLAAIQTISTLPDSVTDRHGFSTAEIAIHPNGRLLYVSNRGHDSLAIFGIDETSGKLTLKGVEPTRCQTPRHFALTPDGTRLFAAGQTSHTVTAFTLDPTTGRLSFDGEALQVPTPVCILFSRPLPPAPDRP